MSGIGSHKVGKLFTQFRSQLNNGLNATFAGKHYVPSQIEKFNLSVNPEQLPLAPLNPYRKRPVKLVYDMNEYHMFRLPSEKHFLLGSFDNQSIFGERKGTNHSPHLRAQMELDSNIIYAMAFLGVSLLLLEYKRSHEFVTRRENMFNGTMGNFKLEDFN
jgi:hypothetical protein